MNICELLESTNQQQQEQVDTNQEKNEQQDENNSKKFFHAQASKLTSLNNELNHNSVDDDADEESTHMDTSSKPDVSVATNSSQVSDVGAKNDESDEEKLDTGGGGNSNSNRGGDDVGASNDQNTNSLYNSYTNNDESINDDDIDYNSRRFCFFLILFQSLIISNDAFYLEWNHSKCNNLIYFIIEW